MSVSDRLNLKLNQRNYVHTYLFLLNNNYFDYNYGMAVLSMCCVAGGSSSARGGESSCQ